MQKKDSLLNLVFVYIGIALVILFLVFIPCVSKLFSMANGSDVTINKIESLGTCSYTKATARSLKHLSYEFYLVYEADTDNAYIVNASDLWSVSYVINGFSDDDTITLRNNSVSIKDSQVTDFLQSKISGKDVNVVGNCQNCIVVYSSAFIVLSIVSALVIITDLLFLVFYVRKNYETDYSISLIGFLVLSMVFVVLIGFNLHFAQCYL